MDCCKNCYQTKCVCDPLFSEIYKLNGYTCSEVVNMATPLHLTITTFVFVIGIRKGIKDGKIDSGITIDTKKIGAGFTPTTIFIAYKLPKRNVKKTDDGTLVLGRTMYNQVELKASFLEEGMIVQSKISVMIFTNGSVKVTGIRNPNSIQKICCYVLDCINKIPGSIINPENGSIKIFGIRTAMINTVFKILKKDDSKQKQLIRQKELCRVLSDFVGEGKPISDIINRSDRGSQTNIKFKGMNSEPKTCVTRKGRKKTKGEVTILSFSTGSMSIIGSNNPKDVRNAYDFICKILQDNPKVFLKPIVRNRE
jgi:TATA-box binding protein (TBP) (component of TFIID and TFIIIB)